MENYIKQLIDDIREATHRLRSPGNTWLDTDADPDNELELEDLSFVEKYYYGEEEPIAQITGIEANLLPPAEKLSDEQKATLSVELEKLLLHFNFRLVFPENYPLELRYPYIKDFWLEKHVCLSFGLNEIEFCDMDDEVFCPFEGYCKTCTEVKAQMKYDEECEAKYKAEHGNEPDWMFDFDIKDLLASKDEIELWVKMQDIDKEPGELDEMSGTIDNEEPDLTFDNVVRNSEFKAVGPDIVSVPALCLKCRLYHDEDPEVLLLCQLIRNDQKDTDDFRCNAFKKI